jgi:hypothetical protein
MGSAMNHIPAFGVDPRARARVAANFDNFRLGTAL